MYCCACIASCPIEILFHSEKEEPVMHGTCALCQVCYYSCPRIELPVAELEERSFGRARRPDEAILGVHVGLYSVRSRDSEVLKHAQDGGAGSRILLYASTIREMFSEDETCPRCHKCNRCCQDGYFSKRER